MEDPAGGQAGSFPPILNRHLGPSRHGDGADAAALAFQIHDRPAAGALLDFLEPEFGNFVAAQAAAHQEGQDHAEFLRETVLLPAIGKIL